MKISVNDKWPFYKAYHDASYISSQDERKVVVLRELGESRVYRLNNISGKELVVYKIDGGLIKSNNLQKCDYGILSEDNVLYLIELKGADYIHALDQLLSTICITLTKPSVRVEVLNARIVLSKIRVPDILTTQEKKLLNITKGMRGDFIRKCQFLEESM